MKLHIRITAAACAAILASTALIAQQPLQYPVAKKGDQVDVYHGTKVADPYRWMEDDMSKETAAWVEAENKVTFPYLEAIPYRAQLQARVKQLSDYPKYGSPFRKGPYYFFTKNEGLQDQSVLYIQKGLEGTPEVLIDPNKWEGGGTSLYFRDLEGRSVELEVWERGGRVRQRKRHCTGRKIAAWIVRIEAVRCLLAAADVRN